MYFPFLRGKQFELIALRELVPFLSGESPISPIIEPVKKLTSTYTITLGELQKHNCNFTVIINPTVGSIKNRINMICGNFLPSPTYDNFQLGIIVKHDTDLEDIAGKLDQLGLSEQRLVLIVYSLSEPEELVDFIESNNVAHVVINNLGSRKILRAIKAVTDNVVFLSDPFEKKNRNKDYALEVDEFFSDEHVYYAEEGYSGYSDYLSIGFYYSDKGYSPYAVAIHLTYLKGEEFWIRHLVSDSNEDVSDVAGKFEEAIVKLIPFIDAHGLDTIACDEFRRLHAAGKYPGLGTVKKLSITNHVELVYRYLT
ncbi:MAG: sce7725 family protein [Bacteroidota bacterium]